MDSSVHRVGVTVSARRSAWQHRPPVPARPWHHLRHACFFRGSVVARSTAQVLALVQSSLHGALCQNHPFATPRQRPPSRPQRPLGRRLWNAVMCGGREPARPSHRTSARNVESLRAGNGHVFALRGRVPSTALSLWPPCVVTRRLFVADAQATQASARGRRCHVEDPRDTESVGQHAESRRPS